MKAHHHSDGGDGEILSSSLNNNSEDNAFLSLCLKSGLTSEQIYSILLQREETKQMLSMEKLAQEETKRKELDFEIFKLLEQENNKRKFQGCGEENCNEFEKKKKIKNSTRINLCDEMILQILQFLNENFNAFKLIIVSKQFYRIVKLLNSFQFEEIRRTEPLSIISFVNSKFFYQIEKLQLSLNTSINILNSIFENCVNLKHVKV